MKGNGDRITLEKKKKKEKKGSVSYKLFGVQLNSQQIIYLSFYNLYCTRNIMVRMHFLPSVNLLAQIEM